MVPTVEEDIGENNRPRSRPDAAMDVDDGGGDGNGSSEEDESSETSDEDSGSDHISPLQTYYTPLARRDIIRLSAQERAVLRRREEEDARLAGGTAGYRHDRRIEVVSLEPFASTRSEQPVAIPHLLPKGHGKG